MSRRTVRTAVAALALVSPLVLGGCADAGEGEGEQGGVVEQGGGEEGGEEGEEEQED